ncbi:response regulator transcription factor [bacterium]|nr:response regulator transcription factor [bacterium]
MTTESRPSCDKASILIVDDHPVIRFGLTQLIDSEEGLEVCGQATDAEEALTMVQNLKPDLVIVDISLKGLNGIELVKQIKAYDERIRTLVHSMHDESLFAERALHAGAMGYIEKQESMDRIVKAIRQVLQGRIYLSSAMHERMLQRMMTNRKAPTASPIETLSDREFEVFELLGNGVSTRGIAEKLRLSIKTIESHRENIKRKLHISSNSELIRHAVQWSLEEKQ